MAGIPAAGPQNNQIPQAAPPGSTAKAREAAEEAQDGHSVAESDASSIRSSWSDETASLLIQDAGPAPPDYAAATANRSSDAAPYSVAGSSNTQQDRECSAAPHRSAELSAQSAPSEHMTPIASEQQGSRDPGLHWPFGGQSPFGHNSPFGSSRDQREQDGHFGSNQPSGRGAWDAQRAYKTNQYGDREDMGDIPGTEPSEETGLLNSKRKWRSSHKRNSCRRLCKSMCCCFFILGVVAVVLIVLFAKVLPNTVGGSDRNDRDHPPNLDPDVTGPSRHPNTRFCTFTSYSEPASFDFDKPNNFSFIEMLEQHHPFNLGIVGDLWIRPAPAEQKSDVVVWVSYATTSALEVTKVTWREWSEELLELDVPEVKSNSYTLVDRACLSLQVSVYVRPGAKLTDFGISSANLDIHSDVTLFDHEAIELTKSSPLGSGLAGKSSFNVIKGDVKLPYWSSRETIIDTISGSVTGNYALRDLLSIHTRSGKIDVSVDPKAADQDTSVVPVFRSASISGSVMVIFPGTDSSIPIRGYDTSVETRSGRITGKYLLGTSTTFSTTSGDIEALVLPVSEKSFPSTTLRTDSMSGDTTLKLLSPYEDPERRIRGLKATHKAVSGDMDLDYAFEWEGKVDSHTMSGQITLRGDHLRPMPIGNQHFNKHVIAHKGSGSSLVDCGTLSGDITFRARDE